MNFSIEIKKHSQAIAVQKENGTLVDYYLEPNFEVHHNHLPAQHVQDWHAHEYLQEIIFVIAGELVVDTFTGRSIKSSSIRPNDLITMNNSLHRVSNLSAADCQFIVFRFIPLPENSKRDITKDKLVFSDAEIAALLNSKTDFFKKRCSFYS